MIIDPARFESARSFLRLLAKATAPVKDSDYVKMRACEALAILESMGGPQDAPTTPAVPVVDRRQVYAVIDSERAYAEAHQKDPVALGEYVLKMEDHLTLARNMFNVGRRQAVLARVRAIASLCVACLEYHGAPPRAAVVDTNWQLPEDTETES